MCSLALVAIFPTHAFAQRVLILVAEDPGSQADLVNDVKSKLDATGRLDQVDVFDAHTATPIAGTAPPVRRGHDVVRTCSFDNPTCSATSLADYVDQGHGVVQTHLLLLPRPAGRSAGRAVARAKATRSFNIGDVLLERRPDARPP